MYQLPLGLKIGCGIIKNITDIFESLRITGKFFVASDDNIYSLYGDLIKKQISPLGTIENYLIKSNSIQESINISEKIINDDFQYIVGVGGGRVLDTCKYAAHMTKRKFISIPTTVSNDGVASPIAVLKHINGHSKSLGSTIPYLIIIDIDIIKKSPKNLIKAGIGDTLSNFTALNDWRLAVHREKDTMNDLSYLMSSTALEILLNSKYIDIEQHNFLETLVHSLVLSGVAMELAGTSRPCSGSEHLLSHALDFYFPKNNLHGLQVAFSSIVMAKLQGYDYSFLIDYIKRYDIQISPNDLNISPIEFIYCMKKASSMRPERYTILNEISINDQQLNNLYNDIYKEII